MHSIHSHSLSDASRISARVEVQKERKRLQMTRKERQLEFMDFATD